MQALWGPHEENKEKKKKFVQYKRLSGNASHWCSVTVVIHEVFAEWLKATVEATNKRTPFSAQQGSTEQNAWAPNMNKQQPSQTRKAHITILLQEVSQTLIATAWAASDSHFRVQNKMFA